MGTSFKLFMLLLSVTLVTLGAASSAPAGAQPFSQTAHLLADDGRSGDFFGEGVALSASGDVALVGAAAVGPDRGAAYLFVRDGQTGAWAERAKLTASDASPADVFGDATALSSGEAFVGAHGAENGSISPGAVYVFARDGLTGIRTETQKLTASDAADHDFFGNAVAVSGDVALIGALRNDDAGSASGAAYIFGRDATTGAWTEAQKLTAGDASTLDHFGIAVAISGDVALVGADGDDEAALDAGAAYVFERDAETGTWTEAQKLTASDASENDEFGYTVAISDDVALVGTWHADGEGAVYVFERDTGTGTWTQTQKLVDATCLDFSCAFGFSVSLAGEIALVGDPYKYNGEGISVGAAWLFTRDAGTGAWVPRQMLWAADAKNDDELFGIEVAVAGGVALVGATAYDVSGDDNFGAAYIFEGSVTPATEPDALEIPATAVVVGPNPFRDRTALAFTLAAPEEVRLSLHDALGREVAVLAAGRYGAGRHEVAVEAGALPSGVYTWRLDAGGTVATGRVTLMH